MEAVEGRFRRLDDRVAVVAAEEVTDPVLPVQYDVLDVNVSPDIEVADYVAQHVAQ